MDQLLYTYSPGRLPNFLAILPPNSIPEPRIDPLCTSKMGLVITPSSMVFPAGVVPGVFGSSMLPLGLVSGELDGMIVLADMDVYPQWALQ
jgi:hypothetical protein